MIILTGIAELPFEPRSPALTVLQPNASNLAVDSICIGSEAASADFMHRLYEAAGPQSAKFDLIHVKAPRTTNTKVRAPSTPHQGSSLGGLAWPRRFHGRCGASPRKLNHAFQQAPFISGMGTKRACMFRCAAPAPRACPFAKPCSAPWAPGPRITMRATDASKAGRFDRA